MPKVVEFSTQSSALCGGATIESVPTGIGGLPPSPRSLAPLYNIYSREKYAPFDTWGLGSLTFCDSLPAVETTVPNETDSRLPDLILALVRSRHV